MNYFDRTLIAGERDESTQIIRHYACSGSCNQGRNACPTPEACEVAEDDERDPVAAAMFWRLYALAVILVALMAVLVISAS